MWVLACTGVDATFTCERRRVARRRVRWALHSELFWRREMRLFVLNCPTCARPAIGTVDLIPGTALFADHEGSGQVEFCGETLVHWDGQNTQTGMSRQPLVTCGAHEWETEI